MTPEHDDALHASQRDFEAQPTPERLGRLLDRLDEVPMSRRREIFEETHATLRLALDADPGAGGPTPG